MKYSGTFVLFILGEVIGVPVISGWGAGAGWSPAVPGIFAAFVFATCLMWVLVGIAQGLIEANSYLENLSDALEKSERPA